MTENPRPNIVYIQSDQHNPAVIGAYGEGTNDTQLTRPDVWTNFLQLLT